MPVVCKAKRRAPWFTPGFGKTETETDACGTWPWCPGPLQPSLPPSPHPSFSRSLSPDSVTLLPAVRTPHALATSRTLPSPPPGCSFKMLLQAGHSLCWVGVRMSPQRGLLWPLPIKYRRLHPHQQRPAARPLHKHLSQSAVPLLICLLGVCRSLCLLMECRLQETGIPSMALAILSPSPITPRFAHVR